MRRNAFANAVNEIIGQFSAFSFLFFFEEGKSSRLSSLFYFFRAYGLFSFGT